MAQRNRQRRAAAAARRRARRRTFAGSGSPAPSTGTAGASDAPRQSPEMISTVLLHAAREHRAGGPDIAAGVASGLADQFAGQPALIEMAVRCAVDPLVGAAWTHGWSPEDLHQLTRRRLDAAGISYVLDAMADHSRQPATARVPERWREQLQQIGAVVWWEPGQGHLMQWARRQRRGPAEALEIVIDVLALLMSLPRLPPIAPPPGSAAGGPPRHGVDPKMLARVRALLAKAESTTYPEEAEALSAKAQELMSRYSLERLVGETAPGSDPQPASARRLWLDSPYVAAKALLVDAVAEANRCRTVLSEKLGFTTVLGDEVDLEIVELLTTSLLVQATRVMVAAGRRTTRTGQSRTRSFRQSFLIAYATRIRERLTAARDAGTAAVADPARLLPVLASRERVVDELFRSMFPESASRSFSVGNAAGWHAGRAAADLAVLDTGRAVTSGNS